MRGLDDGEFLGVFGNFRIGARPDMPFAGDGAGDSEAVVAYCDTTAPALVIARGSGGAWTSAILDNDVEKGPCAFSSLAIAIDDSIHIAYQTTIANDVRTIHWHRVR